MKASESGRTSKRCRLDMPPVELRRLGQARPRCVSSIVLPEKKRRCSAASSRSRGLSNSRPSTRDHAVAADHPIVACDAQRLWPPPARDAISAGVVSRAFTASSSTSRLDRLIFDARRIEHLAADRAGRGKDQGQSNNLVEKRRTNASPTLGTGSTGNFGQPRRIAFEDSSTGTNSIPSL